MKHTCGYSAKNNLLGLSVQYKQPVIISEIMYEAWIKRKKKFYNILLFPYLTIHILALKGRFYYYLICVR